MLTAWLASCRPPAELPADSPRPIDILRDLEAWDRASGDARASAVERVRALHPEFALVEIRRFESGGISHEIGVFRHLATDLEFSLIPGGVCQVEPSGEQPRERKTLVVADPVLVCRTECTVGAYENVVTQQREPVQDRRLPVASVTWYDATGFCDRVALSLPTCDEWEYACRGGSGADWCFGSDVRHLSEYAVYNPNYPERGAGPASVGGRRPNAFGLFDVHGNVSEWCEEAIDAYAHGGTKALQATHRVHCGGSASCDASSVTSGVCMVAPDGTAGPEIGFRPVRRVAGVGAGTTR